TPHVDFSQAAPNRAAMKAIEAAFGTEVLPSNMMTFRQTDIAIVIADDLESSHNVAALRLKDSIVGNPAAMRNGKLIVISPIWGEMADFADPYGGTWLQPRPGSEAPLVDALAKRVAGQQLELPAVAQGDIALALDILEEAKDIEKRLSIVYAPSPLGVDGAANGARAAANLAIALRGEKAAESLF